MTKSSLETIHHLGMRSVSVWKVLGFAGSLALGGAVPLAAQTCLALPVDRNELWVAGGAEWGGQAVQGGALVAANIVDAVGIEWGVGWGGYEDQVDEDQVWSPSTTHVRALSLLRLGTIRVCPFLEWRDHDRSIQSPEVKNPDEVSETAYRIGAALGGDLPALLGTRLGWQATTGLVYRDWDLNGPRRPDGLTKLWYWVHLEEKRSLHLSATLALSMRLRGFGLVIGIGTRPRTAGDALGFVNVGFRTGG